MSALVVRNRSLVVDGNRSAMPICCCGHRAAAFRARPERLPPSGERKPVREVSRSRWSGFPGAGQAASGLFGISLDLLARIYGHDHPGFPRSVVEAMEWKL